MVMWHESNSFVSADNTVASLHIKPPHETEPLTGWCVLFWQHTAVFQHSAPKFVTAAVRGADPCHSRHTDTAHPVQQVEISCRRRVDTCFCKPVMPFKRSRVWILLLFTFFEQCHNYKSALMNGKCFLSHISMRKTEIKTLYVHWCGGFKVPASALRCIGLLNSLDQTRPSAVLFA